MYKFFPVMVLAVAPVFAQTPPPPTTTTAATPTTTAASKPAVFLTRLTNAPKKLATIGSFQLLFGSITLIPAAFVGLAIKNHHAEGKGVAEASTSLAFATVAGAMFTGMSGVLWAQGLSSMADAVASDIWNPEDFTVVKTPLLTTTP